MSDLMLLGVLRLPIGPDAESLAIMQLEARACQAADRIESDGDKIQSLTTRNAALLAVANAAQALKVAADNQSIPMPVRHMLGGQQLPTEGSVCWNALFKSLAALEEDK